KSWDAFGNDDHQLDTAIDGFERSIGGKLCRYVDDAHIGIGLLHGFFHGVKHGALKHLLSAAARHNAAHHIGSIFDHLLTMKLAFISRNSLDQQPRVFIYKYAHLLVVSLSNSTDVAPGKPGDRFAACCMVCDSI